MIKLLEDNGGELTMCRILKHNVVEAVSGLEFAEYGRGIQDMYRAENEGMSNWDYPNICHYTMKGNNLDHKVQKNDTEEPHVVTTSDIWADYLDDKHNRINIVAELNDDDECILYLRDAGSAAWKYLTGDYKSCTWI